MESTEVIVIGAGAAGMMAASTLAKAGKAVTVLEARNRTGGRIHTLEHASFFKRAELGAEFVHGDLPLTLSLLKEAGLEIEPSEGEMWQYQNGQFSQNTMMDENWDLLMEKLNELQQDMSFSDFLNKYFSDDKFEQLRASAKRYLGGYDTGDPGNTSSLALKVEWQNEDEGAQHRVREGYCSLVTYLVEQCRMAGGRIYLNEPVKKVEWQHNNVVVTTLAGEQYQSRQIIIAVPLGVLQQAEHADAAIQLEPAMPRYNEALQLMGFGAVIKVLLSFSEIFWDESYRGDDLGNMAFLFSKEAIPTWWTQAPNRMPLLTGWMAGPQAEQLKHCTNEELLEMALQSLANIFNINIDELKAKLVSSHVANWSADPYTCGSYAYDTVVSGASRQLLNGGIEQTIYFAGEYLYEGPAMGTVEAALESGKQIANYILQRS